MKTCHRLTVALLVAATLGLAGCAHRPGGGSLFDAATTFAALDSGRFVEANPVLSWAPTPAATALASLAVKQGAKYAAEGLGASRADAHRGVEAAGMAAGSWNLALLLGASYPLGALAAAVGGYGYIWLFAPTTR